MQIIHCVICGEPLVKLPKQSAYSYSKRRVCSFLTDNKNPPCFIVNRRQKHSERPESERRCRATKAKVKKLSEKEMNKLDELQARINIEIDRKRFAACGYEISTVKIFTSEEIEQVKHLYDPPVEKEHIPWPDFRQLRRQY